MERNPPIDEIVGLINKHAPADLAELRAEFPGEASELFTVGITAGESEKQLAARRKACLTGLKVAIAVCEEELPLIKTRLKRTNLLRLISDIVAAISGASVVTVLASDFKKPVEYAVGVMAFLGTVLGLVTSYLSGVIGPGSGNLQDLYKRFIECQVEAKEVYMQLELLEKPFTDTSVSELVTRGNVICKQVMVLGSSS